jgi:hypothetical protein
VNWLFGAYNLSDLAHIEVIEDSYNLPPVRGDNPEVPLREGRLHVAKFYDQRKLVLGMVCAGATEGEFRQKLSLIQTVCGNRTRQYLQKDYGNGDVRQALAEVVGSLGFKQMGTRAAKLTVDFLLAEPFFRSVTQTTKLQSISASPTDFTVSNAGTAADRSAVITFTGPLDHPRLTNLLNNVWVSYNNTLLGGHTVVINTANFTAVYDGATNVVGNIWHSGDVYFMLLLPGDNSMRLETNTTGGSVQIQFYPPYF